MNNLIIFVLSLAVAIATLFFPSDFVVIAIRVFFAALAGFYLSKITREREAK